MKDTNPNLEIVLQQYSERFDNLDELMHPQLMTDPRFAAFLQAAIESGKPATPADIEAKFGDIAWEW
jgi:hypothetical protein